MSSSNDPEVPRSRVFQFEGWFAFGAPLLICLAALGFLYSNDWDARIVDRFFDERGGVWPHRDSFVASTLLHLWGRNLVFLVAASALVVAGIAGTRRRGGDSLRKALFLFLCIGLSAGAVALWKSYSATPCPWEALRYGGSIAHISPFQSSAEGGQPGHCFPGGHASGAYGLMGFYFLFRCKSLSSAWIALGMGFALGSLFGMAQVMRGAHYPSHNVWSCMLAWSVCCALYWGPFRGRLESTQ